MPFKAADLDRCLSSPYRFRCHPKPGQPVKRKRRRRESWPRSSLPERFWRTRGKKAGRSGSRSAKEALACCIWVRDSATFRAAVRRNGVINTLTCVHSPFSQRRRVKGRRSRRTLRHQSGEQEPLLTFCPWVKFFLPNNATTFFLLYMQSVLL